MLIAILLTVCQLASAEPVASSWESQGRLFDGLQPAASRGPAVRAERAVGRDSDAPVLRPWKPGARGTAVAPAAEVPRGMRKGGSILSTLAVEFPGYRLMHGADEGREGFLKRLARAVVSPLVGPLCGAPHAAVWGAYLFSDGGDRLGAAAAGGLGFLVGLIGGIGVGIVETFRNLRRGACDLARGKLLPSGAAP